MVYDLLGEGEITLVDGLASIYLDKTPIANSSTIGSVQAMTITRPITSGVFTFQFPSGVTFTPGDERPILVEGASKSSVLSSTITGATSTINVSQANFFTTNMIASQSPGVSGLYQKIRIKNAGEIDGSDYVGEITSVISGTSATVFPPIPRHISNRVVTWDLFTYGTITQEIGQTGNQYTTTLATVPTNSTYNIVIGEDTSSLGLEYSPKLNFKSVRVAYRSGSASQTPIINMPGYTNAISGKAFGTEIKQHVDYWVPNPTPPGDAAQLQKLLERYRVKGYTAFNYADSTPSETTITSGIDLDKDADRVILTITCPSGLQSSKASNDDTAPTGVTFQIWFDYKNNPAEAFTSVLMFGPADSDISRPGTSWIWANQLSPFSWSSGSIYAGLTGQKDSVDFEFELNIDQYKPFSDWRIRIKRITPVNYRWSDNWKISNSTTLKSAQAFIDDKVSYPYSAYCALMLDANEHEGKLPQRAYRVRGLRCEVPSNYVTREEDLANGGTGVASYNRNVTTGAITGSYQNWDGNFRTNVYCNNPVWVLRSLLLNRRFGLGEWISADSINKFSFYSLARRCDELVSNGEGGLEPRFVCGVYLTEATEAYSIIKDFCTIMFSLPFWIDGKLLLEADRPKEPVYTFTKGNIIDGIFNYENVGIKARPNQIAVTFNDSKNFYERAVELVDDVEGMVTTGRIITEEAVAFGAVTRSQAIRYAKWKLLTAKYNNEIINFRTGENAGMLKPGDIIRVQDADRYRIRYSGRVLSATTTVVTLDKPLILPTSTNTYKLSCMVEGDAIYVAQGEAVIQTVTYKAGDILPTGLTQFTGTTNGLTNAYNEETAARLVDDTGKAVKTVWAPNIHLETRSVTLPGGTYPLSVTSLTVSSGFSSAPQNDFIWALVQEQNSVEVETGSNLYRVMGIAEESIGVYSINAGLHFNEKFEELDENYTISTPGRIDFREEVPAPTNFAASVSYKDSSINNSVASINSIDIVLTWTPPQIAVGGVPGSTIYKNLSKYKLDYIDSIGVSTTIPLESSSNTYTIRGVSIGTHEFILRAEGIAKNISPPVFTSILVDPDAIVSGSVKQSVGLPQGGKFSVGPRVEGKLIKTSNNYTFTSPTGVTIDIVDGKLT